MLNSPSHGPRRVPPPYAQNDPHQPYSPQQQQSLQQQQQQGTPMSNSPPPPPPNLGRSGGQHSFMSGGQAMNYNRPPRASPSMSIDQQMNHQQLQQQQQQHRLLDGNSSMFQSSVMSTPPSMLGTMTSMNSSNNAMNHGQQQLSVANGGSPMPNVKETKAHRRHRGGGHHGDEVIEVQILPQDDNWGDNTTCITGATSERSISAEDISRLGSDRHGLSGLFLLHMWLGSLIAALLSLAALLSPLAMLLIPKLPVWEQPWKLQACGPECDGLLISFAFKLCILFGGCWAVFFRKPRATMPRVFVFRALVMVITVVFLVSYWLFYSVRIYDKRYDDFDLTYLSIVQFALSLIDTLLFVHYLAVLLLEIRHLQPQYFVKVVRSPDGASHCYTLGAISIQRAAVELLENYYRDFPVYNPFLEHLPASGGSSSSSSKKQSQSFKVYDLNTGASQTSAGGQSSGRRTTDRLYAEHEYEKRVKKRRARLITAAEDAFTHIKRVQDNHQASATQILMDSQEAAQAVFPSMARALQKYLRITRQQPRHTMQGILEHLGSCLHYDLSPKTFLEKYLKSEPVLQDERELSTPIQSWALVCDVFLSRPIKNGLTFILRQGDVSLMATVSDLPHFNITEEVVDPKCNRFVLRLQSETSV